MNKKKDDNKINKIIKIEDENGNELIEINEIKVGGVSLPAVLRVGLGIGAAVWTGLVLYGVVEHDINVTAIEAGVLTVINVGLMVVNAWKDNPLTAAAKVGNKVMKFLKEVEKGDK